MSKSRDEGSPAYKDPLSLKNVSYHRGKKSDIFSLGVILWEISSGKVPCGGRTEAFDIVTYRLNDYRDPPLLGTPIEYASLYVDCWAEVSGQIVETFTKY